VVSSPRVIFFIYFLIFIYFFIFFLSRYLPQAHHKKANWKDIARLWEKCANMNKINAYYKYVQTCRQLPTYGITTFEVREKQDDKRKLVSVLLGVTRDSVMRMDFQTKELIKAYPLEHVRRWAAAKTTFTLDFGTYEKDYYTVETNRGEEISQLLSGYIDILLKRRGDGVLTLANADADIAETEELGPLMAVPNVSTISKVGVGKYTAEDFREQELMPGRMLAERGNVVDEEQKIVIDYAPAVSQARRLLGEFDNQTLINAGAAVADPSRLRDDLLAAASKLGKAVSDMLGGLDGPADQVNINAEAAAAQLKNLVDAAKLAALNTNDQALMDAGKRVAEAVARMLESSRDVSGDPGSLEAKRALQEAIASLKGASGYLQGAVNGMLTDPASEQLLLESAKQVADAVKRLAGNANRYAGDLDPALRKEIGTLSKRAAGAGDNVQETAKMLAPLIVDPTAKQQLLSAGKMASADCELLLKAASAHMPANEMQRLADAARAVNESLAQMLNAADTAGSRAAQNQEAMSSAAANIIRGLNQIKTSSGNARELDHGIRTVMGAVPTLLQSAKRAAMADSSIAPAIIQSSKEVAGASRMFQGASKSALADPKDMERFKRLLYASQALATATKNLLGDGQKFAVFSAVRSMAKEAASSVTAFANTSRRGIRDVDDESAQRRLLEAADTSAGAVQELVEALKVATLDPENINAQARLVAVAKKTSKPMASAINSGRQVVPDVPSVATKQALLFTTKEAGRAISDLVDACNKAGAVTGEQDIDEAMEMLSQIAVELDSRVLDANVGALKTSASRDDAMAQLQVQLQPLVASAKELTEAQQVGKEAKRAATASKAVADAALAVAATVSGKDNQVQVLLTTKEIIPAIKELVELSRQASTASDKMTIRAGGANADLREAQENLQQKIRDMLTATQKGTGAEECEAAADASIAALNKLVMAPVHKPGEIIALSAEVEQRAASLQKATMELERVVNDPKQDAEVLKGAAAGVSSEVPMLVASVNQITSSIKNTEAQDAIVRSAQVMGGHAAEALRAAATARIDPTAKGKVSEEVQATGAGKEQLETALAAATPGIAELEKALRMVDDALANAGESGSGDYDLQSLHASTNQLGDSAVHVIQAARLNPEDLGKSSVEAARALAAVINGSRGFKELGPSAKNLGAVTRSMVVDATKVARNPGDTASIESVTADGTKLGEAMKEFKDLTKALSPGHVDATKAAAAATDSVANLDKNSMAATVGLLDVVTDKSHQAAKEEQKKTLEVLDKSIAKLAEDVSKEDYKGLGLDSVAAAQCLDDMCQAAINVAASTSNQETQMDHLNQAKDVADKAVSCLQINTALTEDSSSNMLKMDLKNAASDLHDQILAMLESMKGGLAGLQACDEAMETINKSKGSLDDVSKGSSSGEGYAQLQSALIKKSGECAVSGTQLFQTAKNNPESVGDPSKALAKEVVAMVEAARDAAATSTEAGIRESLVSSAKQVADSAVHLIGSSKKVAGDAQNQLLVDELSRGFQDLTSRVTGLIRAVKEGATGERDANEAVNNIRRVVADLDQCAVQASTGDFEIKGNTTLDKCYEEEAAAAKEVAIAAGQLVNSVNESQTALGSASKNLASAITRFGDSTKSLAGATGDVVTQSELFGNSKTLGTASQQLVIAAQRAQANRDDPNAKAMLQEKAGKVKASLQELITGVNSSLGPAVLGVKELTQAQNQVAAAVKDFGDPNDAGDQNATPKDIAAQLRRIKKANESLMTVTGTSDKLTPQASKDLGDATVKLLQSVKGNFRNISSQKNDVKVDLARDAVETAQKVMSYLETSKTQHRDKDEVVSQIQDSSISITDSLQKTIEAARGIPGGEDLELEENKLEDKASQQLLAAAEQIKAAAAMLMNAPRKVKDPSAELDEDDIAGDLLDRARDITGATYDLLLASIDAQKEIQSMGKTVSSANAYRSDPQWAQGLISAAKAVAQTSMDLVHAANGVVKKEYGQEAVVAISRMVLASTARLSAASRSKLPLTSANNERLGVCTGEVNKATKSLGVASRNAVEFEVKKDPMIEKMASLNRIQLMKMDREEAEKMNKAEKDLEIAYRKLKSVRQDADKGAAGKS
jgi:talin